MIKKGNRTLSVICAAAMVMSGIPVNATTVHAEEGTTQETVIEVSTESSTEATTEESTEVEGTEEATEESSTEVEEETTEEATKEASSEKVTEEESMPSIGKEAGSITVAAKDLEVVAKWGFTTSVNEDGKQVLEGTGKYPQIFYKLPEGLDGSRIESVSVDADTEKLSVKLCADKNQYPSAGTVYGSNKFIKADFGKNTQDGIEPKEATILSLMGLCGEDTDTITKVVGDITIVYSEEKEEAEEETKEEVKNDGVYAAKDLDLLATWGTTVTTTEDGKQLVEFPSQYSQVFYRIPVDPTRIEKITVGTDSANLSVKLALDEDSYPEAGIVYGSNVLTSDKFKDDVDLSNATVLCLMSLLDGEMTKEIDNITFELTPVEEEEPVESDGITPISVNEKTGEYVFLAKDLVPLAKWGVETEVDEDTLKATFPSQYNQLFLDVPSIVPVERLQSVSVATDPSNFSVKFCANDSSYSELAVTYGNTTLSVDALKDGYTPSDIEVVCLMNLKDGEIKKDVSTITFVCSPELKKEYKYSIKDLERTAGWNCETEDVDDGVKFTFTKQYGALSFLIPEEVDKDRMDYMVINCKTSTASLSPKFFSDEGMQEEKAVAYGTNRLSADGLKADDMKCIGIMGLQEGYEVIIESVTFKMKEEHKVTDEESGYGDLTAGCFKDITNNNPLMTQRYSADPGVMVYDGTVYIYSTNDIYEYKSGMLQENGYGKIKTINCISSTDLVNWTDHGAMKVAGKNGGEGPAVWANNSWAPCAAHKTIDGKEKFFLYFADNGSGIGVLTSDTPYGPWTDPIGGQLVSRNTPTCKDITWLFDPAVMVDDDGTGYLVFGGGVPDGKAAHPGNARVVKLGDDMISLDGDPVLIDAPYLFEDSGINKIGDKYYYSYCSNWNCADGFRSGTIQYMVSDDPMGPYEYVSEVFANPSSFFNDGNGNNHHSFFEFNGKMYLAYHARALEKKAFNGKNYGYRSTQIDEVTVNEDGTIKAVTATMEGVAQTQSVNPYERHEATMMARQKGIEVLNEGETTLTVTEGDFTGIKGCDFNGGISEIEMTVKADEDMKIEVRVGNEKGSLLGTINVTPTDGEFKTFKTATKNVSSTASLYFVYGGAAEVKDWKASSSYLYTFDKLEEVDSYNLVSTINEDGSLTIDYQKQWAEIRYAVPEGMDLTNLQRVVLNDVSDHGTMCVKLLHQEEDGSFTELVAQYGETFADASLLSDKSKITHIGIMTMDETPFTVTIGSVTFEMSSVKVDEGAPSGVQEDIPDLRDAMTEELGMEDFLVGTAICVSDLLDKKEMALVTKHFNAITFGNELKPDSTFNYSNSSIPGRHVEEFNGEELEVPTLNFDRGDKLLEYVYQWNEEHPEDFIKIRGHVLTWHSQTPEWFFHVDYDTDKPYVDKETMTKRHEWYIKNVLEHYVGENSKYKDMFYGWDVVNEAVSDGRGTYRNGDENSSWWRVYGSQEFITNAFVFANKYAPSDVELYYNDYNETVSSKVKGIEQLLRDVKNTPGARIDGMGMQGHYTTNSTNPSIDSFKDAARRYAAIVGKVQLTELDFTGSDGFDAATASASQLEAENTKLAYRYKEIYDAIKELRAEGVNFTGMTVWGVVDKNSWLQTRNDVGGAADGRRKHIPLLFDNDYQAKPAYWVFVDDKQLAPSTKSITVLDCGSDMASIANSYEFENAQIEGFWNNGTLYMNATIYDDHADDNDSFTVYVDRNGKIEKYEVKRSAADGYTNDTFEFSKSENGDYYQVCIYIPWSAKYGDSIKMDFVVNNAGKKSAFNDYTLSQDTTSEYYAEVTVKPTTTILKTSTPVDLGNLSVWDNVKETPLTINLGSKVAATTKLLWDEENLYVYAKVIDGVLNADSANAHEKDSLEIFIDENNAKSSSYQDDDKQYRINYLNEHSFNGTKCVEDNITSEVTLTEDGYILVTAIKWTDVNGKVGNHIGLELQINDADASGKRSGTLSWFDTTGQGWSSPAVFGTALLVNEEGTIPDESEVEDSEELKQAKAKLQAAVEALEAANEEMSEIMADVAAKEEAVIAEQTALEAANEVFEAAKESYLAARGALDEEKEAKKAAVKNLETARAKRTALEEQLADLEEALSATDDSDNKKEIQNKIDETKKAIVDAKASVASATKELNAVEKRIASATKVLEAEKVVYTAARLNVQPYEKALKDAKTALRIAKDKIPSAQKKVDKATKKVEEAQAKVDELV